MTEALVVHIAGVIVTVNQDHLGDVDVSLNIVIDKLRALVRRYARMHGN
jgi:hypothetical protein